MFDIEKPLLIDPAKLDRKNYFYSLMESALKAKLLSEAEADRVKTDLTLTAFAVADEYTQGESTTLNEETFGELGASILYCLGLELKSLSSPEEAVKVLKREKLKELYLSGREKAKKDAELCRAKCTKLKKDLAGTEGFGVYVVSIRDIESYLHRYDPKFFAHRIPDNLGYEPMAGAPDLDGTEYVLECLNAFSHEIDFLRCFEPSALRDAEKRIGSRQFFEYVLNCSAGLVLAGCNPVLLDLTPETAEYGAGSMLKDKSEEQCAELLTGVAHTLRKGFGLSDGCSGYVRSCLTDSARYFRIAAMHGNLKEFFGL